MVQNCSLVSTKNKTIGLHFSPSAIIIGTEIKCWFYVVDDCICKMCTLDREILHII